MEKDVYTKIASTGGQSYLSIDSDLGLKEENIFAQVTVFDGDHGDCNLIDLYEPTKIKQGGRNAAQWRRVLIDTGYNRADKVIANAIVKEIKSRAVPLLPEGKVDTPRLREMQITHFDDDHIGNAGPIMTGLKSSFKEWRKSDRNYKCDLVMNKVPHAWPTLTMTFWKVEESSPPGGFNLLFRVDGLYEWMRAVEEASYSVDIVVRFLNTIGNGQKKRGPNESGPSTGKFKKPDERTRKGVNSDCLEKQASDSGEIDPAFQVFSEAPPGKPATFTDNEGDRSYLVKLGLTLAKIQLLVENVTNDDANKHCQFLLGIHLISQEDWSFELPLFDKLPVNSRLPYKFEFDYNAITSFMIAQLGQFKTIQDTEWYKGATAVARRYLKKPASVRVAPPRNKTHKPTLFKLMTAVQEINSEVDYELVRHIEPKIGPRPEPGTQKPAECAIQYTTSPQDDIQREVVKLMLYKVYAEKVKKVKKADKDSSDLELKDALINRASVVTVFSRSDLSMRMLFTGDAYDQPCDLRRTTAAWSDRQPEKIHHFDVLKIPHHGSNVTANSDFYQQFRADVYLICGSHKHSSANPRYSSIKAIVQGFEDKTRPSNEPFRLFFSDPKADQEQNGNESAIRRVLKSPELWPIVAEKSRYYKAYKLKSRGNTEKDVARGSILFYKDTNGHMREIWSQDEWEEIT
ncbi:hypothetical protein DL770_000923 [Monosporascus sp. CRB-9-2]|nr:hypothetical protein DL770_000923 [Monosporascus sp. CRB-9-2]